MNLADLMTLISLTTAMNKLPKLPTKIGSSGLFTPKPIRTTQIIIDEQEGKLSLVPNTSRRDVGTPVSGKQRKTRSFLATHLPQTGVIMAEDVQGLRDFGSEDQAASVAALVNDRLQDMKNNLEATREWLRMGALKGQILDADGTTVISNLFTEFGATQKTVAMSLASNTNPRAKIMEAKRAAELACGALLISSFRCYCAPDFLDALVGNEAVKAAYAGYQAAQDRLGGDVRGGFVYGNVEFIEYNASVSGKKFIADGEAYLFPVAQGLFVEAFAPANYTETVNTLGQEFYAKSTPIKFDKGFEMEGQSNPFPVCTIPATVIKLTA